jgi:capsular exopolysaccharide synthesis family protein
MAKANGQRHDEEWWHPTEEQEGLRQYVETIRERKWLVIACVLITTAVAVAYVATAQKRYDAQADLLISPASAQDDLLAQLGVIRESTDPTRDVQTAARLVHTTDIAQRTADKLQNGQSPQSILDNVTAEPVAQSSIVTVTGQADSPAAAQQLANTFAQSSVEQRTDAFHAQIQALLNAGGSSDADRLESLLKAPDPTVQLETLADLPTAQSSPRPVLSIAGGILAGFVLGLVAAFASRLLDPRVRREDQLRRAFRLPILARIPLERGRRKLPLGPGQLSRPVLEAYRTLRGTLAASRRDRRHDSRAILVTGSSPSEGKTTTAINLAASLALSGDHVILIEGDLRRPAVGKTLGLAPDAGIVDVLLDSVKIEDALVTSEAYGPTLGFLLADQSGAWTTELFALPAAQRMIEDAKRLADYVIVDSPPLNDVVDALPLTGSVDDVLIIVRLGKSRMDRITRLAELLATNGVKPAGFAVVGTDRPGRLDYSYYGDEDATHMGQATNGATAGNSRGESSRGVAQSRTDS